MEQATPASPQDRAAAEDELGNPLRPKDISRFKADIIRWLQDGVSWKPVMDRLAENGVPMSRANFHVHMRERADEICQFQHDLGEDGPDSDRPSRAVGILIQAVNRGTISRDIEEFVPEVAKALREQNVAISQLSRDLEQGFQKISKQMRQLDEERTRQFATLRQHVVMDLISVMERTVTRTVVQPPHINVTTTAAVPAGQQQLPHFVPPSGMQSSHDPG